MDQQEQVLHGWPGWDILQRARSAGFSSASMRFVASERYGDLTQNTGVFALCCQK